MFCRPNRRPRIWQSRIVTGPDGLYRGAKDVVEPAEWADCAMVHDDCGEAWGAVAWRHDKPEEWWVGRYLCYPEKGQPPIMGAEEIMFSADMGADLLLVATPARYVELAWCGRWPGPTACVLDWDARDSLRLWLSLVRGVQCETDSLAHTVEGLLGGAPRRQRLRVEVAERAKPPSPAARNSVDFDPGTVLEPFPIGESVVGRANAKRVAVAA